MKNMRTVLGLASLFSLTILTTTSYAQQPTKTIKTQLGETVVEAPLPTDPITARMDSNMEIKLAGPIGVKIPAKDLPIVGVKAVGQQRLWVVQFGAKNAYVVLVDDTGRIFNLDQDGGELKADPKLKPADALITPLPR